MADMKDRMKSGIDNAADKAKNAADKAADAAQGAKQEGQFDVTNTHPCRIRERREEQESPRSSCRRNPFDRGMKDRVGGEDERSRRQDDDVRDDAPLDICRRDGNERRAEDPADKSVP